MEDDKGKKEILVVEDSEVQALALKRLLEAQGYAPIAASNGAQGLSVARSRRPALIISDILMPVMDGYTLCSEVKEDPATGSIPVILLTQLTGPDDIIRGLESGADNYVTKPYNAAHLLGKVRSLLVEPPSVRNVQEERRIEVVYRGKRYEIRAGRARTVSFLLDTCEAFIQSNRDLEAAEAELKLLNERLEEKVRESTSALATEAAGRQAVEEARQESDERLKAVLEAANDAVVCLEPPDDIYLWNRKAEEIFGYAAEEAIGKSLHMLIVPEQYRRMAYQNMAAFFDTGKGRLIGRTVEVTAMRRDSTEFPVEVSLAAFNIKGVWNSVGIIRDITERKRLEDDMRENLIDVEKMNSLMVGREIKMEDLRKEIRTLRALVKELETELRKKA